MTAPLAEQIAAIQGRVDCLCGWRASAPADDKAATRQLEIMRAVLATLESVPAMLAVIEAARKMPRGMPVPHHDGAMQFTIDVLALCALDRALAALPSPPQEGAAATEPEEKG